jgi:hypothetical protein
MKTKRLTLESFKSSVKKIIKEEPEDDDKKFKRELVMNLDGNPISLKVTHLKTNETEIIKGTINHINDFDGTYYDFSPSGFWLNPDRKGMFVMFDEDNQKWVDGKIHRNIKIEGETANDTFLLDKIKETKPESEGRWNRDNLNKRYSNMPQLESFKSVVKKIIKEEINRDNSNVKQWNSTAQEISEALNLWPKNEKKPILGVEYNQWTFDSDGYLSYGDTPLEALYECASMGARAEQKTFGTMTKWESILNYLTS